MSDALHLRPSTMCFNLIALEETVLRTPESSSRQFVTMMHHPDEALG